MRGGVMSALGRPNITLLENLMLGFVRSTASREAIAKRRALDKSQAIIEFGLDGTIITANANFVDVLGYTLADVQGTHLGMFVKLRYRESAEYRRFWERLNRGECQAAQFKRIAKGGREVRIEASYTPILDRNSKPFKVVKYATDVTRQKTEFSNHKGQVEAIGKSQVVISFALDGTGRRPLTSSGRRSAIRWRRSRAGTTRCSSNLPIERAPSTAPSGQH